MMRGGRNEWEDLKRWRRSGNPSCRRKGGKEGGGQMEVNGMYTKGGTL